MKRILTLALLFVALVNLSSCSSDDDAKPRKEYGIFKVQDEQTVLMNGTINSKSNKNFTSLYKHYPKINKIEINECEGSSDDETNLKLSLFIHQKGINTHILDNGFVASGGTDLFLAGVTRTIGKNVRIGVHSWAMESNGKKSVATDYDMNHAYHKPYMNYYMQVGFTAEEAKAFYFFTIKAAPADDIHWMIEGELEKYKILK